MKGGSINLTKNTESIMIKFFLLCSLGKKLKVSIKIQKEMIDGQISVFLANESCAHKKYFVIVG